MRYIRKSYWILKQNSYTCWYECPDCHYGGYDGRTCNQDESQYCPKCGKKMFYLSPLACESCKYNSLTMCLNPDMDAPFSEILTDVCRASCPLQTTCAIDEIKTAENTPQDALISEIIEELESRKDYGTEYAQAMEDVITILRAKFGMNKEIE